MKKSHIALVVVAVFATKAVTAAPPVDLSIGKKKADARAQAVTVKGTVSGEVDLVEYGINNTKDGNYVFHKLVQKAPGVWKATIKGLKPGNNRIYVRAAGPWVLTGQPAAPYTPNTPGQIRASEDSVNVVVVGGEEGNRADLVITKVAGAPSPSATPAPVHQ